MYAERRGAAEGQRTVREGLGGNGSRHGQTERGRWDGQLRAFRERGHETGRQSGGFASNGPIIAENKIYLVPEPDENRPQPSLPHLMS